MNRLRAAILSNVLLLTLVSGWAQDQPVLGATAPQLQLESAFSVLATDFEGADIGEQINAASKAHPKGVRILLPAGRYPFSTSIKLKPGDALAGVHWGDADKTDGTTLEYTGDGIAIDLTGSPQLRPVVTLEQFRLLNRDRDTKRAKYGIYATWATRYFTARNLIIDGFGTGLYLGDCIINDFTALHVYNCDIGIDIKTCYTVQFYSCKIDGGNPGVRINYGNLVTLMACTFESQKGGHAIVIENGGTGNSLINCYFEDTGEKADIYITSDKPADGAVRLVSVEGCTFGSKSYCIELDGHILAATIFRNYLGSSGKQKGAVKISSPNVQRLSIGANIFFEGTAMLPGAAPGTTTRPAAFSAITDQPYIDNPHNVEVYPLGYLPESDRTGPKAQ